MLHRNVTLVAAAFVTCVTTARGQPQCSPHETAAVKKVAGFQ